MKETRKDMQRIQHIKIIKAPPIMERTLAEAADSADSEAG